MLSRLAVRSGISAASRYRPTATELQPGPSARVLAVQHKEAELLERPVFAQVVRGEQEALGGAGHAVHRVEVGAGGRHQPDPPGVAHARARVGALLGAEG